MHVTILDTFKTEWQVDSLCTALGNIARKIVAFSATPVQQSMLGANKDVPVKVLELEGAMASLHNQLMQLTGPGSFVFNTPEFTGTGFLPHATDQKNGQVEIGKLYRLKNISLIDMYPNNDHTFRKIIDTYSFNPSNIK